MLRETSAASTIAASTATGAPAAPARRACGAKTASTTAAPSARPIRNPRIQASFAPPARAYARRMRAGRAECDHSDVKDESGWLARPLPENAKNPAGDPVAPTSTGRANLKEKGARGGANQGRPEKG